MKADSDLVWNKNRIKCFKNVDLEKKKKTDTLFFSFIKIEIVSTNFWFLLFFIIYQLPTTTFILQTIVVEKPSAELNVVEYSTAVTAADLVALTQQRVTVTLSSSKYKEPKIFGKVLPRVQCELYQAVLSASHANQGNKYSQKLVHTCKFFSRWNSRCFKKLGNFLNIRFF